MGNGGFVLNFSTLWTCDDDPAATPSAPGEIDLVSAGGATLASLTVSASFGAPSMNLSADGAISNSTASIHVFGANGSPADGTVHGTWTITGVPASTYTLRFWHFVRSVPGNPLSAINTVAMDAGNSHPVYIPTPTPTPAPVPPSVSLSPLSSATALQPTAIGLSATAGSSPLASASLSLSIDGGQTWNQILSDTHPSTPVCLDGASYTFSASGSAVIRAGVVDQAGLSAVTTEDLSISKAAQGGITITPSSASVTAGQTQTFVASGGSTGYYQWGGAASGSGPTFAATFSAPGTYVLGAFDLGNSAYLPSSMGSAAITVQSPTYTLQLASSGGGTAQGGGSFPVNSTATAVASPAAGNSFSNWSGDSNSQSPSISLLMNSNKSLTAHFSALLAQSISFVAPVGITTRSPAFTLSVSASSGLPVSLALNQGPLTLVGNTLTPTGASGVATITATQAGNGQFLPAPPVLIPIAVTTPAAGTVLSDGSATTKRSDKDTAQYLYISTKEN